MSEALRTPDQAFADVPDYPFAPHYIDTLDGYEGLRVHYVDEPGAASGPEAGKTFLCLHGQPSWSFLYRKMIPVFTAAGGRAVAPDLLGFGKSDKPTDEATYTYGFHRGMLMAFIEALDLRNITLVCQDWGGILGLGIVPDMANRFERLIVMNTAIPIGESPGPGFDAWKAFNRSQPDMDIANLFKRGTPDLTDSEAAAYGAPYPDSSFKSGVRRFPELVPVDPSMEGVAEGIRARQFWSEEWTGQSFMAVGMQDPVLGPPAMKALQGMIRGCPDPVEVPDGGHFVQERGEGIARAALAAFSG
ncbi:haloalkane dehalogenase [Parerythrobacter jejuensis]|uniref:Alpha/beta fold hydrolase n=1 Tax=Parerythrobacter jejuensis TaxID=795812 RepID=A0A845AME6_9SPHN|nr:haloalkane dehalogenase [Parerythrobacter jejuensis]MXP31962.1 alpha/beta fold hydrolase [Parerythrobacter jejuensis]